MTDLEVMTGALQNMLALAGVRFDRPARLVIVATDEREAYRIMADIRMKLKQFGAPLGERDAVSVNGVTVMVRVAKPAVEV